MQLGALDLFRVHPKFVVLGQRRKKIGKKIGKKIQDKPKGPMPATDYERDRGEKDRGHSDTDRGSGRAGLRTAMRPVRPALRDDPRWLLVERIAVSRSLGKSPRLAEFLRYVCDRQIRGRDGEITEQQIGVKVFGRPEGYNSNDDNIVRNYARTLRKRIEEYFRKEGRDEPMVVVIPRGAYVPVFSPRDAIPYETPGPVEEEPETASRTAAAEVPASVPFAVPAPPVLRPWLVVALAASLFAVAVAAGFAAGRSRMGWMPFQSSTSRASDRLWRSLFTQNRDTFLVPADGGLVMMQSFTREKVALPDYANSNYRSPPEIQRGMQGLLNSTNPADQATLTHKVAVLAARRYTSVVDLSLSAKIAQLPEVVPERLVIRFARDLRIDDLHTGNAILIGSSDANPWVSLFEQQLNFQFSPGIEFGGSGAIVNTRPLPGEATHFASITGDPANRTYGVIAYVPNLENTGHVILIEGVNMAGTQAAGDFLLSPGQMRPMLERALDAQGNLQPFEILLETTSIGAAASRFKVLSERVHPAPDR